MTNERHPTDSTAIGERVRDAYRKAMRSRSVRSSSRSSLNNLFQDARLYGRDAGFDFVQTNLHRISAEAVSAAESGQGSIGVAVHGSGDAAIEGIACAIRIMTGLEVETRGSMVTMMWDDAGRLPDRSSPKAD